MGTGAQFSRIEVWVKERLLFADLNNEFNNILNNGNAAGWGGSSSSNSAMDTTTAPAPYSSGVQVRSLATSIEGELQRLRYVIAQITGQANWWTDPQRSFIANSDDIVAMIPFDGFSTYEVMADTIRRGAIINSVQLSAADFKASHLDSSNVKFGNYAYDLGATRMLAIPANALEQGSFVAQFRNLSAGDYIAYNPLLGLELYLDGSGNLTAKLTQSAAASQTAKSTSTVAGSTARNANTAFQSVAMRWSLNGGASGDSFGLLLAGSTEGSQITASTLPVNIKTGGVWFVGGKRTDPTWTTNGSYAAMSATALSAYTDAWTYTGSDAEPTPAAGVLTITTASAHTDVYSKTSNIDLTQMTIETKAALVSSLDNGDYLLLAQVSDHSLVRMITAKLFPGYLLIQDGTGPTYKIFVDTSVPHVYRIVSTGATNPTGLFYIDGVKVFTHQFTNANDAGSSLIKFGAVPSGAGLSSVVVCTFEYFAYTKSAATIPVNVDATGQLDDIAVAKVSISNSIVSQLVNNSVKTVFGADFYRGLTLPSDTFSDSANSAGVVTGGAIAISTMYVAGDGTTEVRIAASGKVGSGGSAAENLAISFVAIDVGLSIGGVGYLGNTGAVIPVNTMASLINKQKLPVGLNSLSVYLDEGGSSGDTLTFYGTLSVSRNG